MDPVMGCYQSLRVLIANADADASGIGLAETAIDRLLSEAADDNRRMGILIILQREVLKTITHSKVQSAFIGLILDFADRRLREIRERNDPQTP
jgi:hypothetical protein